MNNVVTYDKSNWPKKGLKEDAHAPARALQFSHQEFAGDNELTALIARQNHKIVGIANSAPTLAWAGYRR